MRIYFQPKTGQAALPEGIKVLVERGVSSNVRHPTTNNPVRTRMFPDVFGIQVIFHHDYIELLTFPGGIELPQQAQEQWRPIFTRILRFPEYEINYQTSREPFSKPEKQNSPPRFRQPVEVMRPQRNINNNNNQLESQVQARHVPAVVPRSDFFRFKSEAKQQGIDADNLWNKLQLELAVRRGGFNITQENLRFAADVDGKLLIRLSTSAQGEAADLNYLAAALHKLGINTQTESRRLTLENGHSQLVQVLVLDLTLVQLKEQYPLNSQQAERNLERESIRNNNNNQQGNNHDVGAQIFVNNQDAALERELQKKLNDTNLASFYRVSFRDGQLLIRESTSNPPRNLEKYYFNQSILADKNFNFQLKSNVSFAHGKQNAYEVNRARKEIKKEVEVNRPHNNRHLPNELRSICSVPVEDINILPEEPNENLTNLQQQAIDFLDNYPFPANISAEYRLAIINRLKELVLEPHLVDQGQKNLCGPAAFYMTFAELHPVDFAKSSMDLIIKGTIKKPIAIDSCYKDSKKRIEKAADSVDNVLLTAIRSTHNKFALNSQRFPEAVQRVQEITKPHEIKDWLVELFNYYGNDGCVTDTTRIANAKGERIGNAQARFFNIKQNIETFCDDPRRNLKAMLDGIDRGCEVIALLDMPFFSDLLDEGEVMENDDILNFRVSHYVKINDIKVVGNSVDVTCSTWGMKVQLEMPLATFLANYRGAIIAQPPQAMPKAEVPRRFDI